MFRGAEIVRWDKGRIQNGFVDLGDGSDPHGSFSEFEEYLGEGSSKCSFDNSLRVREGMGVTVRVELAESKAEGVGEEVAPGSRPLCQLQV